jgi:hypothetical protein
VQLARVMERSFAGNQPRLQSFSQPYDASDSALGSTGLGLSVFKEYGVLMRSTSGVLIVQFLFVLYSDSCFPSYLILYPPRFEIVKDKPGLYK